MIALLDVSAKTLKVDTVTPSVSNGDFTITPNGSGGIVLGTFSGVLKASTGTVSAGTIDLTSEINGILPIANGGTNSSTALSNNFVMISSGGAIVEDSAVSTTELSYLDGVTSAIQTQLNGKEGTLTNSAGLASAISDESGSGVVLFGTNPAITGPDLNFGTASNSIRLLLPSDTTTNLDLLTDTAGLLGYDTTQSKPVYNNGSGWQAIGSGAGGSRLQLVSDPSFEQGVAEGSCTGCTATQDTGEKLATDNNLASLKMAFSAAGGDYTLEKATGGGYDSIVVSGTGTYDGVYTLAFRPGSILNTGAITAGTTRRFNIFQRDAGGGLWYAVIAYDALITDPPNSVRYIITSDTSDFDAFANGGSYPTLFDFGVIGTENHPTSATQYGVMASPNASNTTNLDYDLQYENVAGVVSAWIKTSASDCHFDEMVNGNQSQTVAISSSDKWKQYIINGTTGTVTYGWRVRCDTAITDDVYVDETFAGAAEPDVFDVASASDFGSVQWQATTNCTWDRSTASFGDFTADADCDDNARTIEGLYNSTNGEAANSDGQKPQIKFSYMPAGTYRFEASGLLYGNSANCSWRFSDGTNSSSPQERNGSNAESFGLVTGVIKYDSPQTSETTINLQVRNVGGTSCQAYSDGDNRPMRIQVFYYPSPQKVFASKCDGLECENTFAARIAATNSVVSQSHDFIDSVSWSSGVATINFKSGVFGVAPVVTSVSRNYMTSEGTPTTSSVTVTPYNNSFVATATEFDIHVTRQGSDYNQMDKRFIPVVDPEARYAAITAADVTATADTLLQLVVEKDNYGLVDTANDKFDIDKTGEYELCAGGNVAAGTSNWAAFYYRVNGGGNEYFNGMAPTASSGVTLYPCKTISLNAGDDLYLRTQSGSTSAISIIRATLRFLPDRKNAFIGNLTPTEFVQTPGSSMPVMYSFEFGGSTEYTDCTASPCTVRNNRGNLVSSVTRGGLGSFTVNFNSGKFTGDLNCTCQSVQAGVKSTFCAFYNPDSSGGGLQVRDGTDTLIDSEVNVICHGVQ